MDFQSRNLTIPRGKILFAEYLTGTQNPGPFVELGNCPEFTLSRSNSKLEHFGSQQGIKVKDESMTIDSSLNGSLTTDDMRATNKRLWFMGTIENVAQTALTSSTLTLTVNKGEVVQLGRTEANPLGARNITVTSIAPSPSGTAYVAGTDYLVHSAIGMVEILPSGSIPNAQAVIITWTASIASYDRIVMGDTEREGELRFVAFTQVGAPRDILLPRVKISPNGDMSLLTDPESPAWQTLALSIEALRKGNLALAYESGRPVA